MQKVWAPMAISHIWRSWTRHSGPLSFRRKEGQPFNLNNRFRVRMMFLALKEDATSMVVASLVNSPRDRQALHHVPVHAAIVDEVVWIGATHNLATVSISTKRNT